MTELRFNHHNVSPRKDLLHFIEEHGSPRVYEDLGKDPEAWIEELGIINRYLTGDGLVGGESIDSVPIDEPDFKKLGKGVFLYRGRHRRSRGLWIRKANGDSLEKEFGRQSVWDHYRIGTRVHLKINSKFAKVPFEEFLPENFERKGKPVKRGKFEGKRPIFTFPIQMNGNEMVVYAKGADVEFNYYFEDSKPKHRLTNIAGMRKTSSGDEMKTTLDLMDLGVKVPGVVGYYDGAVEEFLFLEEVQGDSPKKFIRSKRSELIKQDAEMLAALCLGGYRKMGFEDFDDKVFNGSDLFLIDVDECDNLYFPWSPDYRDVLLNPSDQKKLKGFRRTQRGLFRRMLMDAIYEYRDSLTPNQEDKKAYVESFFRKIGWKSPTQKEVRKLTTFKKNYMTLDSYMAMMSDTG